MDTNILIFYSLLFTLILATIILFLTFKNDKYRVFHIVAIYLGLSIIDTFIPSILWSIYGNNDLAPWLKDFTSTEVAWGILYYSIFYIIMFSIMMFFAQGSQVRWLQSFRKITILLKVELIFLLY